MGECRSKSQRTRYLLAWSADKNIARGIARGWSEKENEEFIHTRCQSQTWEASTLFAFSMPSTGIRATVAETKENQCHLYGGFGFAFAAGVTIERDRITTKSDAVNNARRSRVKTL